MATMTAALPSGEDSAGQIRRAWDLSRKVPGGRRLFSYAIGRLAPYTGSIGAIVQHVELGRAEVLLPDRPHVRNHLRCIHAIALCNLGELAGNLALAYSMPPEARFIPAGLSIDYIKKARGPIIAEGLCPPIQGSERREYELSIPMRDTAGDVVAEMKLRTLVGPRRAAE